MTSLSIPIPEDLKPILDDLDYQTYFSALKIVAKKKIKLKEKKIQELIRKGSNFTSKYKTSLEEFNNNVPTDFQAHEDWIDWNYSYTLLIELESSVNKYRLLLNK